MLATISVLAWCIRHRLGVLVVFTLPMVMHKHQKPFFRFQPDLTEIVLIVFEKDEREKYFWVK
jgi:hypothetical protein